MISQFKINKWDVKNFIERTIKPSNEIKTYDWSKYYKVKGDFEFLLDPILKKHLDVLCEDLKDKDDGLIVIVAPEGAGKTVLETQIGYYCSKILKTKWGIDNIHFDSQPYIDKAMSSPPKFINALDESRRAINKMRASSKANQDFFNYLSECRQDNQIHIIVLPGYSDLDKYVAIHRPKLIIEVVKKRDHKTHKLIRGIYHIINTKDKNLLTNAWKNSYKSFPKFMRVHTGRFENVLAVNEEEYQKKKKEARIERYTTTNNDNVTQDDIIISDVANKINFENYSYSKVKEYLIDNYKINDFKKIDEIYNQASDDLN